MRRFYTLLLFAVLCLTDTFAQNGTGFNGNGYYRICNLMTKRYIYVTDNKDYYDKNKDIGDFQAIQLWTDINRAVSDPASVIYIKEVSSNQFDLMAQNTSVHALTGYYVGVSKKTDGTYEVSASVSKGGVEVVKTLSDDEQSASDQGKMGTNSKLKYRRWIVDRIETNHATNYFGVKPTIEMGGMYYQPFFAAFPFKTVSSDMSIYCIDRIEGNNAILKKIDGEVPAKTPVIIECTSNDPAQNRLELLASSSATVAKNLLSGVYFCNGKRPAESTDAYTDFDAATMRVFDVVDGKLVLTDNPSAGRLGKREESVKIWDEEEWEYIYTTKTVYCIAANTSYLKANAQTPTELEVRFDGMGINDIKRKGNEAIEGIYSLSGNQLRKTNDTEGLPAGLYIVGGRKTIIK